jgi:hypothetical protein
MCTVLMRRMNKPKRIMTMMRPQLRDKTVQGLSDSSFLKALRVVKA